ncbi:MAG TPA: hypothetical protein VI818_03630 [Candidatus Thermoplasmatota archaeon]|nr:hypothetical protein [Candidatus Thermoplasmatota archaeon]
MPQLDEFLGGGLDPGSLILLVEPSGAGGEIFAKQFAGGPAPASPGRSIYFSTEESEREMIRAFDRFHFPGQPRFLSLSDVHARHVLDTKGGGALGRSLRPVATQELLASDSADLLQRSGAVGEDYLDELIRPYTSGSPPTRLTIHSIDFFIGLYGAERVVETLTALKAANSQVGGLVLVVLTSNPMHRAGTEGQLERIADCLIELEFHRRGAEFEKFLLVKKVRNKYTGTGVAPYQVTERGFEIDSLNRIM